MTIATHAGEGVTCASPQGLSSLVYKKHFPQNIALAVTAITTSAASPTLSSLSRAAKSILAFVVRLAECTDPTKPSWAFKTTIAQEIGASEATVYRGLNELIKAGLIERLRQERKSHNGRLFVSRLKLTKRACACLGLLNTRHKKSYAPDSYRKENAKREFLKPAQQAAPQQATVLESTTADTTPQTAPHVVLPHITSSNEAFVSSKESDIDTALEIECSVLNQEERIGRDSDPTTPPQETITAPISNTTCTASDESKKASVEANQGQVIHRLPSVKLIDGINTLSPIDQKQSIKKQPGQPGTFSAKIANRKIPSDLAWLVQDNCLSVTGLLHLMATARRMGHFLSDIVKFRQSAIRPHTGRSLYAYLRALITKPVDYGYLKAQQDKERTAREQAATEKAHRESFIKDGMEKFRGRTFVSEEGAHYTFEDTHTVSTKQRRNGLWYTGSFHAHHAYDLIKSILSGRLREISGPEKAQLNDSEGELRNTHKPNAQFTNHLEKLRALLQMRAHQPAVA